jgi:aldehyde:ferredoxin oxidoreductase
VILEWFNAVTGFGTSQVDFLRAGERIYNLKRMYDVRCGITRKYDIVPMRMLRETRGQGGSADNLPPFSKMLDEYYRYRGWDQSGVPRKEKLEELGLSRPVTQGYGPS